MAGQPDRLQPDHQQRGPQRPSLTVGRAVPTSRTLPAALEMLIESLGSDVARIALEIEKLSLYGKNITEDDIISLIPDARETNIFALVNALGRRDRVKGVAGCPGAAGVSDRVGLGETVEHAVAGARVIGERQVRVERGFLPGQ